MQTEAGGVQSRKMMVTPEMAVGWLELNRRNRPINRMRVEGLKKIIAEGRFAVTHQGVAFYGLYDELADGQHRLQAIAEGDTPVEMMVSTGLSSDAIHAIDRGRNRSIVNVLGFLGMPLTQSHVAAVRALWQEYHSSRNGTVWSGSAIETEQFAVFCDHVDDAVRFAMPPKACRGLAHGSVTAAIASAYFNLNEHDLARFKHLLHNGVGADETETAAIKLREYLLVTRLVAGGTDARQELYFRACTAIRAFFEGRGLSKLYCRPEARFEIPDCKWLN